MLAFAVLQVDHGFAVSASAQRCEAGGSDPSGLVAAAPRIRPGGGAFRGGSGGRLEGRNGDDDARSAQINQVYASSFFFLTR